MISLSETENYFADAYIGSTTGIIFQSFFSLVLHSESEFRTCSLGVKVSFNKRTNQQQRCIRCSKKLRFGFFVYPRR